MAEREGLPVAGYRPQDEVRIALVNRHKAVEENLLRVIDGLGALDGDQVDRRWLAIARTNIEQGFMALNRAVFRPARLTDDDLAALEAKAMEAGA